MLRLLLIAITLSASVASADTGVTFMGSSRGSAGGAAPSGSCTDGVDCFCDTVSPSSTLLFCEDFEDAGYYDDTADGWYAGSGSPHNRGVNSLWSTKYGNGTNSMLFSSSDGTPHIGTQCGFALCAGNKEYCSDTQGAITSAGVADCWGPNSNSGAHIDIQGSGDFDYEIGTLTLTGGVGESADVLGGNRHLAMRVPAGAESGIRGEAWLKAGSNYGSNSDNTDSTEVGITMAIAYSSNFGTEGDSPQDGPFKHDEWSDDSRGGDHLEHWNMGNTGCGDVTEFPYRPFLWTTSESACNTALSGATEVVGNMDCTNAPALRLCSTTAYDQATDFPFGTVACHQAHISGLGTSNTTIKVWHNGTLVIHLTGFDGASALNNQYYSTFSWNTYTNINWDGDGTTNDTDVTFYRYEDNVLVVNGPPEPCSAIGL